MTDRLDWPALMRLGIGRLGLEPRVFWSLTPRELTIMLGLSPGQTPLTRANLLELERQLDERMKGRIDDSITKRTGSGRAVG